MAVRLRRRRTLIVLAAFLILPPLGGYFYETYARARDTSRFPPVGRLVDIDRRHLHLLCLGEGAPVVVFEASGFGNSMSSRQARTRLARVTTVCGYDRMGVGWSDPGPTTISVGMLADDLRALQEKAPLAPPLVLVASSIGGVTAEMFARQYPARVAGLIMLDAATSEILPQAAQLIASTEIDLGCRVAKVSGRVGALRVLDPFGLRSAPEPDGTLAYSLMYRAQPWNMLCALVDGLPETVRQFDALSPLDSRIRVTGLSAESTDKLAPPGFDQWATLAKSSLDEGLRRISQRSSRGAWRMVPKSDHLIAESAPDAVVEAVTQMIAELRDAPRSPSSASRVH